MSQTPATTPALLSLPSFRPVMCQAVGNQACCAATSADVWIIDDDLLASFRTGQVIRQQRFAEQVCTFTQVSYALERLNQVLRSDPAQLPRLILLDIHMPSLNEWDFLDAYAKLPAIIRQRVALYVLSGSIEPAEQLTTKRYQDVRGFMAKPLSAEDLQAIQEQTNWPRD